MAEIICSSFVTMLFEKLASGDLNGFARSAGIHSKLDKWKDTLCQIEAVLVGAEHRQEQGSVQLWLSKLHHLLYDIDDVLDDLTTEAFRCRINEQGSSSTSKVLNIIPTKFHAFKYGRKMGSMLDEITSKLRDLDEEKDRLGLIERNLERSNRTVKRLEETSFIEVSTFVGRKGDEEALMRMLLGPAYSYNFSVVSITGMGGLGKTTLARVLYNDYKVKDHFELRAWVCVSDDFNVFSITMSIYQSVGGLEKTFVNLDLLQVALREQLSNKRFLLVLDDVWNEEPMKWKSLRLPFHVGAPGSKIIVTTRKTVVASIMDSVHTHNLGVLSNEDAMSIFAQHVEQDFDSRSDLRPIAEGIVKKCDGLPLVLKTLGRLLNTKTRVEEWKALLDSDIWNNLRDQGDILPVLRLSYDHLPGFLKQLFAYCSFFPTNYVFEKDELVLLWMAEGFLSQRKRKSLEKYGLQYFEELLSSSFFMPSTNDNQYIMPESMRNLAMEAGGELFHTLDYEKGASYESKALDKVCHLSFVRQQFEIYRKFKTLLGARRLRTLLAVSASLDGQKKFFLSNKVLTEIIPKLQFLRVLNLCNYSITEIPQTIGRLKHIRYLNFSRTDIACLPEQVGDLYNLQSLLLRGCEKLFSLPQSLVKLRNLRHLDIRDTPRLNKLPLGIGKLRGLQTLSKVIVEGSDGFKIAELKGLLDLRGRLSIEGLHNVQNAKEAEEANLEQKKGLDDVELGWNDDFDGSDKRSTDYDVLAGLVPHRELRSLKISFYGGEEFPRWVGDSSFECLTELTLRGCRSCSRLPTLGHLKSLQKLFVEGMNGVKDVGSELLGPADSLIDSAFPSLQVLEFEDMQGWETWSICSGDNSVATTWFPNLGEISIVNCPKLEVVSVASIQSLRVLRIQRCPKAVLESMVCVSSSIVKLMVEDIKGLTGLHVKVLSHLSAVEYLSIKQCDKLKYLWETESHACKNLVRLSKLEVEYCKSLVSLEKKKSSLLSSMTSVEHMVLRNCESLKRCKCPISIERLEISDCPAIKSLTFPALQGGLQSSLKILYIQRCDNMLESWLHSDFLTTLDYLQMGRLPNLRSMPEGCFADLTRLILRGCDHIESITGLDFVRLRSLQIISCTNLKSFPHEHLPNLVSLEELWISNCPSLDSFPCGKWPPTLKSLTIGGLKNSMSNWGPQAFSDSLVTLYLHGENSGLVSFASNSTDSSSFVLPSSLTFLEINSFQQLKSVSAGLQHLTNLKGLVIDSCPKLGDLPVAILPELSSLKVYNCLELQERCHSKIGKYRSIISGIPELYV